MFGFYTILFEKQRYFTNKEGYRDSVVIDNSTLTQKIMDYCHLNGIEILKLDLRYSNELTLKVFGDKKKYWALIKELCKEEYHISLRNC